MWDGEQRVRNFFETDLPTGTTIEQHYSASGDDKNRVDVKFSAVCECGKRSPVRATRADALTELAEQHPEPKTRSRTT